MKKILVVTGMAVSMFASSVAMAQAQAVPQAIRTIPKVREIILPRETPPTSRPTSKGEVKINENGQVELNGKPLRGAKAANQDELKQALVELDKTAQDNINAGSVCRRDVMGTIPLKFHKTFALGEVNKSLPRSDCVAFMTNQDAIDNGSTVIAKAITVSYDLNLKDVDQASPEQARTMHNETVKTFASETNQPLAQAEQSFGPVCMRCLALNRVICTGKSLRELGMGPAANESSFLKTGTN